MSCNFKFEKLEHVWASKDRKSTEHLRIEKAHEDGTVETYLVEKIEPTKPFEVFFKHPRTGAMETIHPHIAMTPTTPQYYEVRQNFHQSKPCGDALGGFCTGGFWELPVTEAKMNEVLSDFCKKGYKQVPYIKKQL